MRLGQLALALLMGGVLSTRASELLNLSGEWALRLDSQAVGIAQKWPEMPLGEAAKIRLPGTTDEARLGTKIERMDKFRLTRRYAYVGPAWYQRTVTVPQAWSERRVSLFLERCLWATELWVDGQRAGGREDSLLTPHIHSLGTLSPGKHTLTLRVDNSPIWDIGFWSHAYSDEIQTIWNGVVGKIELRASDFLWLEDLQVLPGEAGRGLVVRGKIGTATGEAGRGTVTLAIGQWQGKKAPTPKPVVVEVQWDTNGGVFAAEIAGQFQTWDEFEPALYVLQTKLNAGKRTDEKSVGFGVRRLTTDKHHFYVNGRLTYFRGTHDAGNFPLTGYPSTKVEDWRRIFATAKAYGLNHFRFHSWTPPEAAFVAADELGIYLQCELPLFSQPHQNLGLPKTAGGRGRIGSQKTDPFLRAELDRILRAYANHPSFCMVSMGNELKGDVAITDRWVAEARQQEPRILFASYSNPAAGGRSGPGTNDQFMVFHGWGSPRRGESFLNQEIPGTSKDYDYTYVNVGVPTLPHEVGQWCIFPNLREIDKYTGVLRPTNLELARDNLARNGLLAQADDFLAASGRFSVELYREEIERALRSADQAGFQLLDIHDYPGQGSAWIGVLDAFWDSKSLITPEAWRRFCGPNVLLARLPKRVWRADETANIGLEVASYGAKPLGAVTPEWSLRAAGGKVIASGVLPAQTLDRLGLLKLGALALPLKGIKEAASCELRVSLPGAGLLNSWELWVYPAPDRPKPPDVLVTSNWESARAALAAGRKVLFLHHNAKEAMTFTPPFWNVNLFGQPGVHGLLCDPKHPALARFPTESHANWQWWELMRGNRAVVLTNLPPDYRPIVQPIDQPFRGQKLGSVFEFGCLGGKLMVCAFDLESDLDNRVVARQLRASLLSYMSGPAFNPRLQIDEAALLRLLPRSPELPVAPIATPKGFEKAVLYIRAGAKHPGSGNVKWSQAVDDVKICAPGFSYRPTCEGVWKDNVGTAWHNFPKLTIEIGVPRASLYDLYVHFADWDTDRREGTLNFEGRQSRLGPHHKAGKWVKLDVLREDCLDGRLVLEATCSPTGPNLMVTDLALVPKE